ncbi:nucleotidyltransferase family protein [Pseudoalteromonas sp. APM04]|uniref:nucleotidyltransferase family protein n=1 Tax=Pseudoalteromonas sp. APM04 TaxID=2699396 RepID=UPI003261A376
MQLRREFSALSMAFADSGYPLVLLKGAAYLALHLPHAKGRRVSDLDLLVPKAYLEDAEQRLSTLGWHQDSALTAYDDHYYRYWMHEVPPLTHAARHIELDLHHTLVPPTSRIRLNDEALFSAVEAVEGYSFSVLSAQDRYLHSAVHLLLAIAKSISRINALSSCQGLMPSHLAS